MPIHVLLEHIKTKLEYLKNLPKCDQNSAKQTVNAKSFINLMNSTFQRDSVEAMKDKCKLFTTKAGAEQKF